MSRSVVLGALVGIATLATFAACAGDGGEADTARTGATAAAAGASADSVPGATTATNGSFIDPDAATREQLLTIPGVNATTADALVASRPYQSMVAVDRVLARANLSEQQRDTIYTRLWKPIDLNTASKEEILLIPGVGPKIQREFEEYRPYRSIERFRREIGKYVRPEEVARLERYVTVRSQTQ
jgi:DNA uptake protein ComE-like DNA-binding protein